MKRLCVFLMLAASSLAQGPFGFQRGMTKEQILAAAGTKAVDKGRSKDDSIVIDTAPKPHPDVDAYILFISPKEGLLKVVAISKGVPANGFGDRVRDMYKQFRDAMAGAYGPPTRDYDFLKSGSIWHEPEDFMMGLLKEERLLVSYWGAPLPNRITAIKVGANALSNEHAYIELGYEFEGWDAYVDQKGPQPIPSSNNGHAAS